MFYAYVILCVMKYVIKYVMNMYVCRLGHMTHKTNKTPNRLWAYDLLN